MDAYHPDPLYSAACCGDLAGVKDALWLRNGGARRVNARFRYGETALHGASGRGHLAIVKVLLDAGANIDSRDDDEGTPLHNACCNNHLAVVRELIRRGADIYAKDIPGDTPFDSAASIGYPTVVPKFMLQHYQAKIFESEGSRSLLTILKQANFSSRKVGLQIGRVSMDQMISMLGCCVAQNHDSIRERDSDGNLPIHIACRSHLHPLALIQYLLRQDPATLHIANSAGSLPIHLACDSGVSMQVIKYLVEESEGGVGTLCARDSNGNLPIHVACSRHRAPLEMIQYLAEQAPATLCISNNNGALPIHLACQFEALLPVIKYLVEANGGTGTLTASDSNGRLPIHLACSCYHVSVEMIQCLAGQAPSMLFVSNNNEALPIHVACQFGVSLQVIKYLVEENGGADTLHSLDNNGYLPLHFLCGSDQPSLEKVQYLIKVNPAALSTRSISGDLPITLACESASLDVVYTLLRDYAEVVPS